MGTKGEKGEQKAGASGKEATHLEGTGARSSGTDPHQSAGWHRTALRVRGHPKTVRTQGDLGENFHSPTWCRRKLSPRAGQRPRFSDDPYV